ncbi:MAG: ABC transporter permease [Candidatus Didemnitutus sp.]|nr:ABC transporter permease [Candidatus Didemnitutus sp.]
MQFLKIAFRQVRQRPGFTFMAAFSLALGVGLVATQFSLIDGILLRGLPVPGAERLMHISLRPPGAEASDEWTAFPYRDFLQLRERQTTFESLAGITAGGFNLSGKGRVPTHEPGAFATANLLTTLGVGPEIGRWFSAEEDRPGQPLLIVLSHALWVEEFGADASVLGRALTVNGDAGTIIGVMPPKFVFPVNQRLWINMRPAANDPRVYRVERAELFGKLRPGVARAQAVAELSSLQASLQALWPETNTGIDHVQVQPLQFAYAGGGTQPILYLMLAMTGLILALACVNVANMLLGRAAQRTRELAVRTAVGASRARIVRLMLGESSVLAALGAAGGVLLAYFGIEWLQSYLQSAMEIPGWFEFRLDARVVGAAIGCTAIAGLLAGLLPAWQASRLDMNTALKDDHRAASSIGVGRIGRWLVTAQIAFTSALLVAACVLGWTIYTLRSANLGYHPEQLLFGRIELQEQTQATPELRARFFREMMARLSAEPGVEAVAVTSRDFIGPGVPTPVAPEGVVFKHPNDRPNVWLEVVSTDYFRLVGVTPVHGRLFDSHDQSGAPRVAVVNESFAHRFWPGQDAIGRRFKNGQTDDNWVQVVGVVPDLKMQGLFLPEGQNGEGFYLVQDQMGWGWLNLFVRTKGDPVQVIAPLRRAIIALDPDQPVHSLSTLQERTRRALHGFSVAGVMSATFALVTLFLGSIGVYGVTSLAVSRRTREFGVRMALGSTVGEILRLVLWQGGRQITLGLAIGLVGGLLLTRPVGSIFGAGAMNNPLIYLAVALLTSAVGLFALWIPARRAARIDPMEALRTE